MGRKAIEQHHAPLFTEPRILGVPSFIPARLTVLESRIRLLREDVAVADVNWRLTGAIAGNGEPWGDRTGIISAVLTRDNGRWLITVMHNMDLPQPPA